MYSWLKKIVLGIGTQDVLEDCMSFISVVGEGTYALSALQGPYVRRKIL